MRFLYVIRIVSRGEPEMNVSIEQELSFPISEYEQRLLKVRSRMKASAIDVLLVHDFPNICYLSGFLTFNTCDYCCLIVPVEAEPCLVLRDIEHGNANLTSWVKRVFGYRSGRDPIELTAKTVCKAQAKPAKLGIEKASAYVSAKLCADLETHLPDYLLVDCSHMVLCVRLLKTAAEIEYMRQAAMITRYGMEAAIDAAHPGASDNEIAAAAYQAMIGHGSEFMSIDPVVSAGKRSGIPHANHRRQRLANGDSVLIEMGACIHRYNAPLMRSLVLGEPSEHLIQMADACRTTLDTVISSMKAGVTFDQVAAEGKNGIAQAGPSLVFHDTYAYSIGLGFPPTWADCPVNVRAGDLSVLQPGMVFHLPISLRCAGEYGVAISETVAIEEGGCEVLTDFDRKLIVKR